MLLKDYFVTSLSSIAVVSDLGRSSGWFRARAQTALAVTPRARLTPNKHGVEAAQRRFDRNPGRRSAAVRRR